jgi:hypothetical protein
MKSAIFASSQSAPPLPTPLTHTHARTQVAQGGGAHEALPMLLRVPVFGLPREIGGYSMLGFGDIVLPGVCVSVLLIFFSVRVVL